MSALVSGAAHAQPDIALRESQQRFDEGNRAYAAGRYEEARVKFTQAWANLKNPNVLFNLARSEHLSGKLVEAARHYRAYLRLDDPKITAKDRKGAEEHLGDVHGRVGRIDIKAPSGTTVTVDGDRVDESELSAPVEVEAGVHKVTGGWAGKTKTQEVLATAGAVTSVGFTFEDAATRPSTPVPAAATNGELLPVERPSQSGARTIVGVSLLGASAVTLGVGVGFMVAAGSAADERDRLKGDPLSATCPSARPLCTDLKDAAEARTSRSNVGTVLLIGGGVLAAAGITTLVWPNGRSSASAIVVPSVSPSLAGVLATGHF